MWWGKTPIKPLSKPVNDIEKLKSMRKQKPL